MLFSIYMHFSITSKRFFWLASSFNGMKFDRFLLKWFYFMRSSVVSISRFFRSFYYVGTAESANLEPKLFD